jgi:Fe-S-cluster-containing hydrogenase component 2
MGMPKKLATNTKECVACGACVNACPFGAVALFKGVRAKVDKDKCVGCGKCALVCPANVIVMTTRS